MDIAHQRRLRQFQDQHPGIQPATSESITHVRHEVAVFELYPGNIDRHGQWMALTLPLRTLAACHIEYPPSNRDDQTARFEHGQEFAWLYNPADRMTPAQECLSAGEDARQ